MEFIQYSANSPVQRMKIQFYSRRRKVKSQFNKKKKEKKRFIVKSKVDKLVQRGINNQ